MVAESGSPLELRAVADVVGAEVDRRGGLELHVVGGVSGGGPEGAVVAGDEFGEPELLGGGGCG